MKRTLHLVFGSSVPGDLEGIPEGDRMEILPSSPFEASPKHAPTPEDIVGLIFEYDVVVTW